MMTMSDDSDAAPGDGELGEELQGVKLQQEVRGVEAGHQLPQQARPLHSLGANSCVKSKILLTMKIKIHFGFLIVERIFEVSLSLTCRCSWLSCATMTSVSSTRILSTELAPITPASCDTVSAEVRTSSPGLQLSIQTRGVNDIMDNFNYNCRWVPQPHKQ